MPKSVSTLNGDNIFNHACLSTVSGRIVFCKTEFRLNLCHNTVCYHLNDCCCSADYNGYTKDIANHNIGIFLSFERNAVFLGGDTTYKTDTEVGVKIYFF